jgi:ubiquinone/menaquinone biosynthesis C-methylase UbiE
MFFRKPTVIRDPLAVTMSGVRMGERLLQIGVDDPRLAGTLASKVGLSGHAAMVVTDEAAAARARSGIADAGSLVDLHVAPTDALPFEADGFDAIVLHNLDLHVAAMDAARRGALLRECRRVLRGGGRLVVIEAGTRTGMGAMLRPGPKPDASYEAAGGTAAALGDAGFKPVRVLGDREGFKFIEGLKT